MKGKHMLNTNLLETLYDQFVRDVCDHLGGNILDPKKVSLKKRLSRKELKELSSKFTHKVIAKKYGVSIARISQLLKEYGMKAGKKKTKSAGFKRVMVTAANLENYPFIH
jgi:hypothetical protein